MVFEIQLTLEQCGGLGAPIPPTTCKIKIHVPYLLKKSTYKWTPAVQTHVAQGSTVYLNKAVEEKEKEKPPNV